MKKHTDKKYNFQFLLISVLCIAGVISSCKPDKEKFADTHVINVSQIKRIELKPENLMLIADGRAVMNLTPIVYVEIQGKEVRAPESRIKDEWLEYSSDSGIKIGRNFSTSDKTLIGKTIDVKVSVKGTSLVSNTAQFKIVDPLAPEYQKEVVFPVVFHIIRQNGETEATGGRELDKKILYDILDKFNLAFNGKGSLNPVGVDTYIRFKPVIYTPKGSKLLEPGINRVGVAKIEKFANNYQELIKNEDLMWDPQKYLNIWLVSNPNDKGPAFSMIYLSKCKPKYKYPTAKDMPEGLKELKDFAPETVFSLFESGIIYMIPDLGASSRGYSINFGSSPGVNELTFYLGMYLGLRENNKFKSSEVKDDYCEDTMGYIIQDKFYKRNETPYKETPECFFFSQNIMDDPTGMHISVSKEQTKRIRWVIENCPERASWKSSFALTGN